MEVAASGPRSSHGFAISQQKEPRMADEKRLTLLGKLVIFAFIAACVGFALKLWPGNPIAGLLGSGSKREPAASKTASRDAGGSDGERAGRGQGLVAAPRRPAGGAQPGRDSRRLRGGRPADVLQEPAVGRRRLRVPVGAADLVGAAALLGGAAVRPGGLPGPAGHAAARTDRPDHGRLRARPLARGHRVVGGLPRLRSLPRSSCAAPRSPTSRSWPGKPSRSTTTRRPSAG